MHSRQAATLKPAPWRGNEKKSSLSSITIAFRWRSIDAAGLMLLVLVRCETGGWQNTMGSLFAIETVLPSPTATGTVTERGKLDHLSAISHLGQQSFQCQFWHS